jgi:hypothetical protein
MKNKFEIDIELYFDIIKLLELFRDSETESFKTIIKTLKEMRERSEKLLKQLDGEEI